MVAPASPWTTLALLAAYMFNGGSTAALPSTPTTPANPPAIVAKSPHSQAPASRPQRNPSPAVRSSRPVVLGYYAQFSPSDMTSQNSLTRNRSRLTSVAPLWYSLSASGELIRRGYDRSPVFKTADPVGLPVLALVTNSGMNDSVVSDPRARARAIDALAQLVKDNHLAGVNIDFEGLTAGSKSGLTAFMRDLYKRLKPGGYMVTMAVPARRSADEAVNDWVTAYDYQALGASVDYLVLMTYDQHWQTGSPGPVAALWWVDEAIRYAVARVPRSKILLGLAGYGYDWASDGTSAVVSSADAERLAAQYGAKLRWDDSQGEATFEYWRGKVHHTVWVENGYSGELRLRLADQYGLAGVALWRLGQEDNHFWQAVDRFSSGTIAS